MAAPGPQKYQAAISEFRAGCESDLRDNDATSGSHPTPRPVLADTIDYLDLRMRTSPITKRSSREMAIVARMVTSIWLLTKLHWFKPWTVTRMHPERKAEFLKHFAYDVFAGVSSPNCRAGCQPARRCQRRHTISPNGFTQRSFRLNWLDTKGEHPCVYSVFASPLCQAFAGRLLENRAPPC
jgi:hypothetical protein